MDANEQSLPPQAIVMEMVMGAWVSQTISTITRLDVPDLLHEHGALTARQLTDEYGVDANPEFLERALRASASLGIVTEDQEGRFGSTDLSGVLTLESPASVKKLVEVMGGSWWKIWTGLEDAIRTGTSQAKNQLGMEYWDYCAANPKEMEDFGEAMKSNSVNSMNAVLEHCDLEGFSTVVDVGGGFGHLAMALCAKYPELRGVVLDLPDTVKLAESKAADQPCELLARMEFTGGDMFESVPEGDAFLLKHIIHDWDDPRCRTLLANCVAGMSEGGRVICVDAVLPPMGDTGGVAGKLLDLDMMVFIPGMERTEAHWRELYDSAGLEVVSITPIEDNFGTSIIEGARPGHTSKS